MTSLRGLSFFEAVVSCLALFALLPSTAAYADQLPLIGRWKLDGDTADSSGLENHGINHGVALGLPGPDGKTHDAAHFDGRRSYIEVPSSSSLQLGTGDFTLTVLAKTDDSLDDVIGDLASKFDSRTRRGWSWCIKNGHGVAGNQANFRNIQFGIDSETAPIWRDCGRPGNAVFTMAMAVHDGHLYVGTCEPGDSETGHVYRHQGGDRWIDCGSVDGSNAVTAMAVFDGKLYVGTGRYRLRGSALAESKNRNAGGTVFRYDGDDKWIDCGQIGDADAVGGLGVFRGALYATAMYNRPGFFCYDGARMVARPAAGIGHRISALGVFNGRLYAVSLNGCEIYCFDGAHWSDSVVLEPTGQTYSFEVHAGRLCAGTWRNGRVYSTADGKAWTNIGRLGQELEVMGMSVYNGKLYAGTLPLAEVHRYDEGTGWSNTGRLDDTPNLPYHRAWSMAIFRGNLYCGTCPPVTCIR